MHAVKTIFLSGVVACLALSGGTANAADDAATRPAADEHSLYQDPTETSSANVVQLVKDTQINATFTAVRDISLKGNVFVIHWGHSAVTLLPSQYVMNFTVNKRATPPGASSPP